MADPGFPEWCSSSHSQVDVLTIIFAEHCMKMKEFRRLGWGGSGSGANEGGTSFHVTYPTMNAMLPIPPNRMTLCSCNFVKMNSHCSLLPKSLASQPLVPKYRSSNVYTSNYIRHRTVQCEAGIHISKSARADQPVE